MENASKALIIAGAILISILLISVGIMVMSSTNGVQEQMVGQMSGAEISTYNAQFQQYIGTTRKASEIQALYNAKVAANGSNTYQIKMVAGNAIKQVDNTTVALAQNAEFTAAAVAKMSNRKTYTVVIDSDATTGIYTTITVTQN